MKYNGIKENYANLKTQCYYRISDKVNNGLIRIEVNNETVKVAGTFGTKVKVGSKVSDIRDLIKADMRAIKRDKPDDEGKRRINDKADQKTILNGRSPDLIDCLMMREYFELRVPEYSIGSFKANA